MTDKRPTKLVALGDFHCGHRVGLTPLSYDFRYTEEEIDYCKENKPLLYNNIVRWQPHRRALWDKYDAWRREIGEVDVLVVNGDLVDGGGQASGGSELIHPDINIQIDMAVSCIQKWHAKKIYITYGTAYHTGKSHDWEDSVAEAVGAEAIKSQLFLDVEGVTFDFKHHPASGGNMPHTRKGPLTDQLWNNIKALHDEQPKADVIIRNHLHWYTAVKNDRGLMIQMPALQGAGSKFGARRCHGSVNFGLVSFDLYGDGKYDWHEHIARVEEEKQKAIEVEVCHFE